MMTIRLSEHYMLEDLVKSKTASRYQIKEQFNPPVAVINNLSILAVHVLENVRVKFPDVEITSGYRCQKLNKAVAGAPNSQHMKGQAVDLVCRNMVGLWEYLQTIYFDQLIQEGDHIHVSYNIYNNRNQIIVLQFP